MKDAHEKLKILLKEVLLSHYGTKNRVKLILKLEDLIKITNSYPLDKQFELE